MLKAFSFGFFFVIFMGILSCSTTQEPPVLTKSIREGWQLRELGKEAKYPAIVPSEVHWDLMKAGVIPDPFLGSNEDAVQWVSEKDWVYTNEFQLEEHWLDYDQVALQFEGLDTYAEVSVNGHRVLQAENMFIAYEADVKEYLKAGTNELKVVFNSPLRVAKPLHDQFNYEFPAQNDAADEKMSVFTRKAPYMYGWDWGPRLVTMGIYRPVNLRAYNAGEIRDFHLKPQSISEQAAEVEVAVEVHSLLHEFGELDIYDAQDNLIASVGEKLQKGANELKVSFTVEDPKLWWPNGMGEQHLYEYRADLRINGKLADRQEQRIGFKTVEVVNEPDADGESFYLKVNGKPLFMKGTNYIPQDNILPRVTEADYVQMLNAAKEANNNMIRVWGGGIYENDQFYELCDELGLLVWQDFMFACTMYPWDKAFLANVKKEAEYNVKRLRNHASLAMWCGNNEVQVGWENWGWHDAFGYSPEDSVKMYHGYEALFKELLPEVVADLDAGRFYYPSSPISNWGDTKDFAIGDNHYWGVWWGKLPFESYNTAIPRFMSEFGFQSFPIMSSIKRFSEEKDWALESPVMNIHQKSSIGNVTILEYMQRDYRVPEDFEDFVYVSQVLQGYGMQIGMEAHRRNMPFCMGSLVWQLNDVWPAASWSAIDYYGKRKAFYFTMQRAFEPILISTETEEDQLKIYLVSDLPEHKRGKLVLEWKDFTGKVYQQKEKSVDIASSSSEVVEQLALSDLPKGFIASKGYLKMTLEVDGEKQEKHFFYRRTKDLKLPETAVKISQKQVKEGFELTLTADAFAKDVYVDAGKASGIFSNNFVDVEAGVAQTILFRSEEQAVKFSTKHIRETY
ncbi:beta-mannosidase [Persicobacter diffluens]|uniref:Beta-mannosidase n=1 Tax=Persicobacter diffluens TaxID=981 RepID=A0AAN5ALP5_9BACT|nr:beta-mannosidase [Persicobacter diffluens]